MNNLITWNCYHNGKEPDWALYNALELAGCVEFEKDTLGAYVERADGETPDFYTLYAHLVDGGCEAIHDFSHVADIASIRLQCGQLAQRIHFRLHDYS